MQKTSFILLLILTSVAFLSCSKKPLHTSKTLESSNKLPEAGSIEWIDRLQYDHDNKLAYGYFNDARNLVIRTMTSDRNTITKMFAAGFTIHIDTTGKKEGQFAVRYPMAQGMQNMKHPNNNSHSPPNKINGISDNTMHKDVERRLYASLNRIELSGFSQEAIETTQLNTRTGAGITAWIKIDSTSTMYYELKIPLADIFADGNYKNKLFSIGLISGEMELPRGNNTPAANMSMDPGGNRQQGHGSRGNMERQQRMVQMQTLNQSIEIWVKRIELK